MPDNFKHLDDAEIQEVTGGATGYNGPCFVYSVKKGDTLDALAKRYKTTTAILIRINRLNGSNIYLNQKLLIPYMA